VEAIKARLQRIKAGILHPPRAFAYFRHKIVRKFSDFVKSAVFDRKFQVETRKEIAHKDLYSGSDESEERATQYTPTPFKCIKVVVRECQDFSPTAFVDIGCGKGRVCFYMARLKRYSKITGIDLSQRLIDDAKRNLASFSSHDKMDNIEFMVADAKRFALPDDPSLVFLFNPFDGVILGEFIQNNLDHFRRYKSRIAYVNDYHSNVLSSQGFKVLFRDAKRQISLWELHPQTPPA
jgi:SAM-dependent methyltransferase